MHILIVSQYFWPESFKINDLATALVARGHQVSVLTGMPSYPHRQHFPGYSSWSLQNETWQSIHIHRVPLCSRGNGNKMSILFNYLSFIISGCLFAPFRCTKKYDAIFVFQTSPITSALPAVLLRRLKKIPLILWVQDLWPETLRAANVVKSELILSAVGKLVKFIYKRCDKILVQSQAAMPAITAYSILPEKIGYFPNWAERLYQPQQATQKMRKTLMIPDGFCVMFAGNIGVAQSFATVLFAAKQLQSYPQIQWLMIGDGRQYEWLKQQIEQLGLGHIMHLFGRKPMEMMPEYFAHADCLLLTLRNDPIFAMTVPSKLQSYLACARPVVAAIDGEGAFIIQKSGAGFVGAAEDGAALAENVLKMYHCSTTKREQMGKNGRSYFEDHFERERLLVQFEAWLQKVSYSAHVS